MADDEIRRILNDRDIEILRKRSLCAIKDMDDGKNMRFEFRQVYHQMGLDRYNLLFALRVVIQDHLLPQELIQI
jgi:hypothetical protein